MTTTLAWWSSRSSRLTAVVCSGRNRPQDSNGQWEAMPRARRRAGRRWWTGRRRGRAIGRSRWCRLRRVADSSRWCGEDVRAELSALQRWASCGRGSGDQVNMITQSRLKAGWELVTQLDTDPTAKPTDVRCQFTPQQAADPSTGLVIGQLVMTVGGSLLADIHDMQLAEQWLSGVRRRGGFALYLGPLNVHRWRTAPARPLPGRVV